MICPKCGNDLNPTFRVTKLCPDCGTSSGEGEPRIESDQASSFHPNFHFGRSTGYCPWEDEEGTGFMQGLLETLRQSIFEPTNFFQNLPLHGGYKFPFLYALIILTISILSTDLASTILDSKTMSMHHGIVFMGPRLGSLVYLLLVVILQILIKPVVLYVCLLALGAKNATFEGTFRISCYSTGPRILNAVPWLGSMIAFVWEFVILVIGLRNGFCIGIGRTIIAILLPLIVTVTFFVVAIILVIGKLFWLFA